MNCVICEKDAGQYGNNAQPIAEGRCCDKCNDRFVIPIRIRINVIVDQVSKNVEEAVLKNRRKK